MEVIAMTPEYDEEFKQHAVRLVLSGSRSGAQAARELGIPANTLSHWVKEYRREHPYPLLRPWHATRRSRDFPQRQQSPPKPWPTVWTPLDEFYAEGGWTLNETHRVTQAEQAYEILLHWHERVMLVEASAAERNWCPLCPASWGERTRFQVPPERQPFDNAAGALGQWDAWIRHRSRGDWLTTPDAAQELRIREYTRLIVGDPHSTLARLTERLADTRSPGLRFCSHLQEQTTGPLNTTPIFVPQWAVAEDPRRPCPLCVAGLPAWPRYTSQSASLPEDVHAPPDGDLYAAVREVQDHGINVYDPEDIDCPDCRRAAEWRREHGPKEPAPADEWVF
jgi:hypothetical protein